MWKKKANGTMWGGEASSPVFLQNAEYWLYVIGIQNCIY